MEVSGAQGPGSCFTPHPHGVPRPMGMMSMGQPGSTGVEPIKKQFFWGGDFMILLPIGSMYGIYANIWGILMVNVTIYGIHGSYGYDSMMLNGCKW